MPEQWRVAVEQHLSPRLQVEDLLSALADLGERVIRHGTHRSPFLTLAVPGDRDQPFRQEVLRRPNPFVQRREDGVDMRLLVDELLPRPEVRVLRVEADDGITARDLAVDPEA